MTNLGQFAYSKTVIKVSTTGSAQAPSPLAGLERPGHRGGPRGHALPHAPSGGTIYSKNSYNTDRSFQHSVLAILFKDTVECNFSARSLDNLPFLYIFRVT